ncbi:putative DNA-binding domain, KAT8 regulatory NSL complex subunit 2 [Helianthus annuus]|nr:putative DNA-binding domain, KAT8 regulatory NSL complex subunit 2 [Helianthus annuus]
MNNQMPDSITSMGSAAEVDEDVVLPVLGREEVVKRRCRRLKQLGRVYKDHYWCMMDELKRKYRRYYWSYGKSPVTETNDDDNDVDDGNFELEFSWCAIRGCKNKAMALTKFCHAHILSDSKQTLYMRCNYVVQSLQAGPIICGKTVLKCTVPPLCPNHYQKAEKHVTRALKKAGLNVSSTNKVAPKFHILIAESVRQIQISRRIAEKEMQEYLEIKEEEISI